MWGLPTSNGSVQVPLDMYVCLELPEAQMPEAERAVAQWNKSLAQWKKLRVERTFKYCDVVVEEVTEALNRSPGALAWADKLGGSHVSMRKGFYEQDVQGILMHEIGHILGAQHMQGTLMDAEWSPKSYPCPDRVTVAQVAAWNHVSLNLLTWCW